MDEISISSEKIPSPEDTNRDVKNRPNMDRDSATLNPENDEVHLPTESSQDSEYITGFRLYAILAGLTLVMLLIMLDQTIVVTVSVSLLLVHSVY